MSLHPAGTARKSLTVLGITAVLTAGMAGVANATPPGIPSGSVATTELGELSVAAKGSMDGYDRDKFPHWIDQGSSCDTREVVLKRDGTNVKTGSDCYPTSGSWTSPYDGATWTQPSDIDIDHVVPLGNAWVSGASSWTTAQRQAYANDLDDPQLIAVTDNVNQSKSDKSPDEWKPPSTGYYCTYASMWVHIKHKFELTVTSAEKSALSDMLGTC